MVIKRFLTSVAECLASSFSSLGVLQLVTSVTNSTLVTPASCLVPQKCPLNSHVVDIEDQESRIHLSLLFYKDRYYQI